MVIGLLFFIFNIASFPYNVKSCSGFVVPIPTLPAPVIRIRSFVEFVINRCEPSVFVATYEIVPPLPPLRVLPDSSILVFVVSSMSAVPIIV